MRLLIRHQIQTGARLALPIDVDLVGELTCGLTWDWEPMPDEQDRIIWARLVPAARRVDMNERYASDLRHNQGLDRFTRGHEIGHWELHAVHPVPNQLILFPVEAPTTETVFCRGRDESWQEKQADWFAAALLMPADVFLTAVRQFNLMTPEDLGALKRMCDVSWAALTIRLKTLGVPHVDRQKCSPLA